MRMYAMCRICGRALAKSGDLCPACARTERREASQRRRPQKRDLRRP